MNQQTNFDAVAIEVTVASLGTMGHRAFDTVPVDRISALRSLFVCLNRRAKRAEIRQVLKNNGWTWAGFTTELEEQYSNEMLRLSE